MKTRLFVTVMLIFFHCSLADAMDPVSFGAGMVTGMAMEWSGPSARVLTDIKMQVLMMDVKDTAQNKRCAEKFIEQNGNMSIVDLIRHKAKRGDYYRYTEGK